MSIPTANQAPEPPISPSRKVWQRANVIARSILIKQAKHAESLIRQQRRRTHMATFVLVPGAGGMAWYWHRAVPLIRAAGHEPIAVDLPGEDSRAGLADYADIIIRALAERRDVVLVAQS